MKNLEKYLDIQPEIKEALAAGKPVLALESTIISHGMPYPENLEFAKKVEKVVRAEGAIPATTAVLNGKLKVGVSEADLEELAKPGHIAKASRRDIPYLLASGKPGATTVASTMIIAAMAGIKVFATGGIGGVHRGAQETFDISADLQELAHTNVAVVCAGAKSLLDIGLTLEYLETFGVPVLGFKTNDFPAFYCRQSGFGVDYNAGSEAEIAKIAKTKWELGLDGGMVIGNPIPEEYALDFDKMDAVITKAVEESKKQGIRGKDTTPFLLSKIKELTGGESFASNLQLAYNNARVASRVAVELSKLA